jgi:hypothetical protein
MRRGRILIWTKTCKVNSQRAFRSFLGHDALVEHPLSIPICLILDSRVDAGIPSLAAAPPSPATFPRLSARAFSIISFS